MATKAKAPIPIPFKANGSLLGYSSLKFPDVAPSIVPNSLGYSYAPWDVPNFWKDNFVFQDTLIYKGISSGRSAINPYFESETTKAHYQTFVSEFNAMIFHMVYGKITGDFTFAKRGANYSLVFLPENKDTKNDSSH